MTVKREFRKSERSPQETARLRSARDRYQQEKPAPEQLLTEGGHANFVSLGQLLELHAFGSWMKTERAKQKMTLASMEEMTGIDQAALSRLENGQNSNPTVDTLYRVAAALGKVILCNFADAGVRPKPRMAQAQ